MPQILKPQPALTMTEEQADQIILLLLRLNEQLEENHSQQKSRLEYIGEKLSAIHDVFSEWLERMGE